MEILIVMNYHFFLNNNDHQNLQKIFNECNLKIKKIISKNFIEGATLIKSNYNINNLIQN